MSREKDAVVDLFEYYGVEIRKGDLTQDTREFGNPGRITLRKNLDSLSTHEMDELFSGVVIQSGTSEHLIRITESSGGNRYELLVTKVYESDIDEHKVVGE